MKKDPSEAYSLVGKRVGLDTAGVSRALAGARLEVTLEQALLLSLEDEARWAMSSHVATATTVPDYLRLLDLGPLTRVRPDRVSVIR